MCLLDPMYASRYVAIFTGIHLFGSFGSPCMRPHLTSRPYVQASIVLAGKLLLNLPDRMGLNFVGLTMLDSFAKQVNRTMNLISDAPFLAKPGHCFQVTSYSYIPISRKRVP